MQLQLEGAPRRSPRWWTPRYCSC